MIYFLAGLFIGLPLGWIACGEMIRFALISGRITLREIAEKTDRILDAADEFDESPVGPRTLS